MAVDMTRPIPCMTKVRENESSINQQYHAICKELNEEVFKEMANFVYGNTTSERLAEELTDVITACTTMLEMIGYNETKRADMQCKINEKNRNRGYWVE